MIITLKVLKLNFSLLVTPMSYYGVSPKLMRNQITKPNVTCSIFHGKDVLDLSIKSTYPRLLILLLSNSITSVPFH